MKLFHIPDYTMLYDDSRLSKHGGLITYVHDSFAVDRLDKDDYHQNSAVFESMILKIHKKANTYKKYIIGNIYRRPSDSIDELLLFNQEFALLLNKLQANPHKSYICGDFNINLLKINDSEHYNAFFENVTSTGFSTQITMPTRLSDNSNTLIDNIFTNNICKPHESGILVTPISDHLMQFCIFKGNYEASNDLPKYIEVETINSKSINNFKCALSKSDVFAKLDKSPNANPDSNYNILATALTDAKVKHLPKKNKKFNKKKHFHQKWMTDELLQLVIRKNTLYKEWKATTDEQEYLIKKRNFRTFDNIVEKRKLEIKQEYYYDTFQAQKTDLKKSWGTLNEALNRNKQNIDLPSEFIYKNKAITDRVEIANSFNEYFVNIGPNLSEKIDPSVNSTTTYKSYLTEPTNSRLQFTQISELEVISAINNLENKTSYGCDGISNKLLKLIKNEISKPITLIVNQCLTTGIFPTAFKIAKVKPIYKKGNKSDLNNYRPISLLPTISKIFERVIHTQLYNYLSENKLLCEQQYGFRSQHSTELAAIKLVDYLTHNMDTNKIPTSIYLDLSKAFDTLSFDILLTKFKHYGITGVPLKLLTSYIKDRYQYVIYNGKTSNLLEIRTGIPQGSILGPLFFCIYINDIIKASAVFNYIMYADDTTLYCNLEDFVDCDTETAINRELQKINLWLLRNKLTLNVDKAKFMIFHKRKKVPNLSIALNNIAITKVDTFNYLGILLDSNLSWKSHTDMLVLKISTLIGVLHRVKKYFPKSILLTIYKSLITPHLNYGLLLWGNRRSRVNVLQKKAIRVVNFSPYISHSEPIFKNLKLLNMDDLFTLKKFKFLHKLAHNTLPTYFNSYRQFFIKKTTAYNLRNHALPLPRVNHVFAEKSLVYELVKLHNDTTYDSLIFRKIEENSHSLLGFSKYVTKSLLEKYSVECIIGNCYVCNRMNIR